MFYTKTKVLGVRERKGDRKKVLYIRVKFGMKFDEMRKKKIVLIIRLHVIKIQMNLFINTSWKLPTNTHNQQAWKKSNIPQHKH